MKRFMRALLLLMVVCAAACATPAARMETLSLGMSKKEVKNHLGEPAVVRGAVTNQHGQVIEVLEYILAMPSTDSAGQIIAKSLGTIVSLGLLAGKFKGERRSFWLYFMEDKLVQWGQAGDWQEERKRISGIRFYQPGSRVLAPEP